MLACITVEGTISNCASLCLHDVSIDKTARRDRAKALRKLGMLFRGVAEALESQMDQRVRVAGLKARPEVNGLYGTVEGINPLNGRVHVKVRPSVYSLCPREALTRCATIASRLLLHSSRVRARCSPSSKRASRGLFPSSRRSRRAGGT